MPCGVRASPLTNDGVRHIIESECARARAVRFARATQTTGRGTDLGIRIRPEEVEVPEGNPFENDLLKRKEPADILTQLVDSIDGPCVLAVDAPWGAGKTTFIKMWSQHLRNEGFPVVGFNAWNTDHAEDPFVALVVELTEALSVYRDSSIAEKIQETKTAAKKVVRRAVPGVIRVVTAGILDVEPLIEKEAGRFLSSYAEGTLAKYNESRASFEEFETKIEEMASTLAASQGHPLIVIVDELDRCRPSYAVELIEVAKHLFEVDHIIFVLAVNRTQLTHSIKALYGRDFDAAGYLRRFLDVDFRLPDPDRIRFIDALLDGVQIARNARDLLQSFFTAPNISLRQIGQAIHRLGLVAASLGNNEHLAMVAGVALILRTLDSDLYRRFVQGAVADQDMVDAIFDRAGISKPKREDPSGRHKSSVMEAIIAMSYEEILSGNREPDYDQPINSPLIDRYRGLIDTSQTDDIRKNGHLYYAQRVTEMVDYFRRELRYHSGFGFLEADRRIELLTTSI